MTRANEVLGLAFSNLQDAVRPAFLMQAVSASNGQVPPSSLPIGERPELADYAGLRLAAWGGAAAQTGVEELTASSDPQERAEHLTLREEVEVLVEELDSWRSGLAGRAVMVAVEPTSALTGSFATLCALEDAIDDGDPGVTSAQIAAYAALEAGLPYAALGDGTPATAPAIVELADVRGLPISAVMRSPTTSNPAILASIAVEAARCLDLARRRGFSGRVDVFDALFSGPSGILEGDLRTAEETAPIPPEVAVNAPPARVRHRR